MDVPPIVEATHAFVGGATAGSIAAAFTTPFDVVKTRRQIMIGQSNVASTMEVSNRRICTMKINSSSKQRGTNNDLGTFGHMRHIVQQEGIGGLWKGNLTRMVKVAPACAIMISCYEFGKRVFGNVTL